MDVLLKKIQDRTAKVLVVGGGYVGLPLAIRCAEEGFQTIVYDISDEKVDKINAGESYIDDVFDEELKPLVEKGKLAALRFTEVFAFDESDEHALERPDVVLICVPTPLNKTRDPDVSFVVEATKTLVEDVLFDDHLVILESTVYPGFTDEVLVPELEKGYAENLFVAFSPERVDPKNRSFNTKNTPKVVGGINEESTKLAVAFYEKIIDSVVEVSSTKAAEMTKILENTFRMINIGLANETALNCRELGIDVWEVIDAASTKPFGFMKFTPGPGVGGHCIGIDPHYLSWKLKTLNKHSKFISLAEEVNSSMHRVVIGIINNALNSIAKSINESDILILGVAYKPDISDVRESPALDIIEILREKGARISYYDPMVPKIYLNNFTETLKGVENPNTLGYDCAVILTDHSFWHPPHRAQAVSCRPIVDFLNVSATIVDTRNATRDIKLEPLPDSTTRPIFRL